MNHTLFAWTEPTPPEGFPAYVNISRDKDGKHTITVRSRGNGGKDCGTIALTPEHLELLVIDVAADLYREDSPRRTRFAPGVNTDGGKAADPVGASSNDQQKGGE